VSFAYSRLANCCLVGRAGVGGFWQTGREEQVGAEFAQGQEALHVGTYWARSCV
jgi:hypothetical protein